MTQESISEDDLHAYVDGVLEPHRLEAVEAYLEGHPDVAERVSSYIVQRDQMLSAFSPITEEPVPSQLHLRHLIEKHERQPRPIAGRLTLGQAAAAAVMLLFIGGAGGWGLHGNLPKTEGSIVTDTQVIEGIDSLAREASASYVVYANDRIRPVEIRANRIDDLRRWISDRLETSLHAPDLSNDGYRFMGGRVVATGYGPAALFMYDDDHGVRLVMLARKTTVEQDVTMQEYADANVAGFSWASEGMGYSLVGPISSDSLQPIAKKIRKEASFSS